MIKHKTLLLAVLSSLFAAACAAAPASFDLAEMEAPAEAYAPEALERGALDQDLSVAGEEPFLDESASGETQERIVIKNADLSIVVDDPAASMDTISVMAEDMGGFVVSSNLYQTQLASGIEVPQANITIRVPAELLQDALEAIEKSADRVLSKNVSGQDVTREYTDLQSHLRNLLNAEAQLREIMASATKTEDVLNVYYQLTQVTNEIEIVKGQIQYYEQSADFSAISVTLIANEADQPISIGGWEPVGVAKDAIEALIRTLQTLADALIWLALYALPVALALAIPLWLIWRGLRGWRLRRKAAAAPASEES